MAANSLVSFRSLRMTLFYIKLQICQRLLLLITASVWGWIAFLLQYVTTISKKRMLLRFFSIFQTMELYKWLKYSLAVV